MNMNATANRSGDENARTRKSRVRPESNQCCEGTATVQVQWNAVRLERVTVDIVTLDIVTKDSRNQMWRAV
jgi:hypothetical protein